MVGAAGKTINIDGNEIRDINIYSSDSNTMINGTSGNDTLNIRGTNVTVDGGAGDDYFNSSIKYSILKGNSGNDLMEFAAENSVIDGGDGDDNISANMTATVDATTYENFRNTLIGGAGNDYITNFGEYASIDGGTGNDYIYSGADYATIMGGKGNDIFVYTNGDGNDFITDYSTGDKIKLTKGTVSKYTSSGKDGILTIGTGKITLKNIGESAVTVVGADNKSTVYKNVAGVKLNNAATSKATSATLTSAFKDKKFSAADYSALVTITAADFNKSINIVGNAKNNKILGSSKADTIYGGSGNDSILGNSGNDKLFGDAGNATIVGGKGSDIFVYTNGDGNDFITDYSTGDKIKLTKGTVSKYTSSGKDGILTIGSGKITLKNVGESAVTVVGADNKSTVYKNVTGVKLNNAATSKATSATLTSAFKDKKFSAADYSALVTITAADFNKSINIVGNAKNNKKLYSQAFKKGVNM